MTAFEKMRLTLPQGDTFEAQADLDVSMTQETQFVLNGFNNLWALFEDFILNEGTPDSGNGLKQTVTLGTGAGVHLIQVGFNLDPDQGTWGDASASDSARKKLTELDHALNHQRIDSLNPATLELYEYSDAGIYDPLDVVVRDSTLRFDAKERVSTFDGELEFVETASLDDVTQSFQRTG